jgi:hypothetical protein
VVALAAETSA